MLRIRSLKSQFDSVLYKNVQFFLKICHNSFKKLGNKFSFPWSSIYLPTELKFKYEPCRVGDIVDILSIDQINLYNIF